MVKIIENGNVFMTISFSIQSYDILYYITTYIFMIFSSE